MDQRKEYVNRVAVLCNLVSRPELNGKFVFVERFDVIKDRFVTRILPLPNDKTTPPRIFVKITSLVLADSVRFADRFVNAPVVG